MIKSMKVHYTSEGIFARTKCPYGHKVDGIEVNVNSFCCTNCKFYSSTNRKEKYVVCMADCSSQLNEILNKIDDVIANNKYDDIYFEDFLAEIRENIAQIIDEK